LVATGPGAARRARTEEWRVRAEALARASERGEIDDDAWFAGMAAIFDAAYLEGDNPRAQSGFGGDEARWEAGRRAIADAIDRDGSFLDIGCANGYLMECVVRWSPHRIEPYGLDFAPAVAQLARKRLPQWADRIFLGNALTWDPPRRFDFVRTELVYVPEEARPGYVRRLLDQVVAPGGRLIVCSYGSPRSGLATDPVGEAPEGGGSIVALACLRAPS
jgi:SAM-dependent methyltransferase